MHVNRINHNIDRKEKDRTVKAGAAAASILTTGAALAHVAKRQGFSLSPSSIKKTPVKDLAIFRLIDKNNSAKKTLQIEEKEILQLAGASVAGGLTAGLMLDDKRFRKSKLRESVNQLLGNVAVPVACVGAVSRLYKKHKNSILSKVPQIKETGKMQASFNKVLRGVPFTLATGIALGIGIIAGNKVSNFLNEKVFRRRVDRRIKKTDFAPHVDDLGIAVSLMSEPGKVSSFIQRTVPAFLCVPGYETGTHRD